jgi:hypothetical protein
MSGCVGSGGVRDVLRVGAQHSRGYTLQRGRRGLAGVGVGRVRVSVAAARVFQNHQAPSKWYVRDLSWRMPLTRPPRTPCSRNTMAAAERFCAPPWSAGSRAPTTTPTQVQRACATRTRWEWRPTRSILCSIEIHAALRAMPTRIVASCTRGVLDGHVDRKICAAQPARCTVFSTR